MSFINPPVNISEWKRKLLIILRLAVLLLGLGILIFASGSTKVFGILVLLALGLVYLPQVYLRNRLRFVPVEMEILFLAVIILNFVLGDTLGLYENIVYYDKFMHFTVSLIVGLVGMMFMFTAYLYGRLKTSFIVMAFVVVMVTLGIGAVLELVQFTYDTFLYPHIYHVFPTGLTQGSPNMDPLTDTMADMFFNGIGAIVGSSIGVWLSNKSKDKYVEWVENVAKFTGMTKN